MLYRVTVYNQRNGRRVSSAIIKGWWNVQRVLDGLEHVPYDAAIQPSVRLKAVTGAILTTH